MTVNALLSYFGIAILFVAAVFFALGIVRFRTRRIRSSSNTKASPDENSLLAMQRADLLCGTILLAVAPIAEVVSLARGGPGSGEPSGNPAGGALAIALGTLFSVMVCLVARHLIILHLRRKLGL